MYVVFLCRTTNYPLLSDQEAVVTHRGSKYVIGKAIHGLAKRVRSRSQERHEQLSTAPMWELLEVAAEAARIGGFCTETQARVDGNSATAVQVDVFSALAGAFEREATSFSVAFVEGSFPAICREPLRNLKFGQRAATIAQEQQQHGGALSEACKVAAEFLEETHANAPSACGSAACKAVVQHLVDGWVRQFRRALPKLSTNPQLSRLVEADEHTLKALARRWGADVDSKDIMSDPVQPLCEVRCILEAASSSELVAMSAARLEELLGKEQGRALANAAHLVALR